MFSVNPMSPLYNTAIWFESDGQIDSVTNMNFENSTDNKSQKTRKYNRRAVSHITTSDRGYNISVEMPGVSRENLEVKVENNYIIVSGLRNSGEHSINYYSNWTVGNNVSLNGITARCSDGILDLFVPTITSETLTIKID